MLIYNVISSGGIRAKKIYHMSILRTNIKQTQYNHIKAFHVNTFKLKDLYFIHLIHFSTELCSVISLYLTISATYVQN